MKRKLLFAAMIIASALGLRAQTNLIAGWDGGDDTSSPSNFGWTSSANRTLNARNASSGIRMTTNYSGYKLEDETTYSYSATSDPSSVIFWVRYNSSGESFTYTFQGLEPDTYYDFSALVGWHNNSNSPTFTVKINDGTSDLATITKAVSAKQTMYAVSTRFKTSSTMTNTTDVKLVFTCNQTGDCMEAISALSLVKVNVILKDDLETAIGYATTANTYLNNSDLTTAIGAAQDVYDDNDATQNEVNDAESALYTAVTSAVNDNPLTLINPGFESTTAETTNWAAAASPNSADYTVTGWKSNGGAGWSSSAVVAYGGTGQVNGASAPSADNDDNSGKALGISVGWSGLVTYQTVTPITLQMGYYTMKVNVYNNNNGVTQFKSKNGFVPTSGSSYLSSKESFTYGQWEEDVINFTLTEETEGYIQIGGEAFDAGSGSNAKVFFDNITLSYKSYETAWTENKDAAQDILDDDTYSSITGAERTAVTDAIAATPSTAAEYEAAFSALETAVNAFTASLADYTELAAEKSTAENLGMDSSEVDAVVSTDNTAVVNIQNVKVAEYEHVSTNYPVDGYDLFIGSWTVSNFDSQNSQHWSGQTRTYYDKWSGSAANSSISKSDVTLPAGTYVFMAAGRGQANSASSATLKVVIGDDTYTASYTMKGDTGYGINTSGAADFTAAGEGHAYANNNVGRGWEWRYIKFTLANETSVSLSIEGTVNNSWVSACDTRLLTTSDNVAVLKGLLQAEITAANAIDKTSNVGTGVFQIPSSAVNDLKTAIENAQSVYDNTSATSSQVSTATSDLKAAETAYANVKLNAPDPSKRYWVTMHDDGQEWDGFAITFEEGGRSGEGDYAVKYLATANTNYNQALKFTPVEGNKYKISGIRVSDGTELYLTGKLKGYESGGNDQIRTINDENKALEITVSATTTDNQFKLINETGTEIARNNVTPDNGVFAAGDVNSYFTIAEASQASVELSIGAGKLATRIFPFVPSLPSGVEAYVCDANTAESLTLTKVDGAVAANTPYILYSENEVATQNLKGWGTASASTYTVDYLTGVFARTQVPEGRYVLQTNTGVQAFYAVSGEAYSSAYRVYVTIPGSNEVKLGYTLDDVETAIEAAREAGVNTVTLHYDATGRQVSGNVRGLNIIRMADGSVRKVMVK